MKANVLAGTMDISETVPRNCKFQMHRSNVPPSTPEEYYCRTVYIPFLDDLIRSLEDRFESHKATIVSLQCVLPTRCQNCEYVSIEPAVKFYGSDVGHEDVVESEFQLWCIRWKRENCDLPITALESLVQCNKGLFPNIYILLKLLAVLPVSTATVERSFSTLRRIKSYLRNTTSENRSNGLALLSIHRDFYVTDDEVIEKCASVPRKMNL